MFAVILVFFALFISFYIYSRRWANPFKLVFIFGKKGAGKSCYMVRQMLWHMRRGWHIYTDMSDINIPGVRIISSRDLEVFTPDYHSALFLDEVGITFDNRNFKSFPAGIRDFFKFQRKYRVKVFMNSQAYDVDKKIRDVTDGMILQSSIFDCISLSRPIKRSVSLTQASSESDSRVADQLVFKSIFTWQLYWMPKYHKYFDSFAAPPRKPIPYTEVTAELLELRRQSVSSALQDVKEESK